MKATVEGTTDGGVDCSTDGKVPPGGGISGVVLVGTAVLIGVAS